MFSKHIMNPSIKHTFLAVLSLVAIFVFAACDTNTASPQDLEANQLEIVKFTASDDDLKVVTGSSVDFNWEVSDPNKEFDHVEITPGGTTSTATKGTQSVKPESTGDIVFNIYAKGENSARETRSISITVVDANGDVIDTPPVAEICTDTKDNDYDSQVDCDDTDCTEDAACQKKYEITYTLKPASGTCKCDDELDECSCTWASDSDLQKPKYLVNEAMTLSWTGNDCSEVTMMSENGGYTGQPLGAESSYGPFALKSDHTDPEDPSSSIVTTNLTLYCYASNLINADDSGSNEFRKQSEVEVKIGAYTVETITPTYEGDVKTNATSSIIYGDDIEYTWDITTDYASAKLEYLSVVNEAPGRSGTITLSQADYGDADSVTFTFTLVDTNTLSKTYTNTVTINKFGKCTDCLNGVGEVKQVVPGYSDDLYILGKNNKVYSLTNDGKSTESSKVPSGDIITIATDTESNLYAATLSGIYQNGHQISYCCDGSNWSTQAIFAKDSSLVLVGTTARLYMLKKKSGSCDTEHGWVNEDDGFGYCVKVGDLGGISEADLWSTNPASIQGFVANLSDPNFVIAKTNVGTYYSENAGESFDTTMGFDLDGGYIKDNNVAYLWNSNDIKYFSSQDYSIMPVSASGLEGDVNFATETDDIEFVATSKGAYYKFSGSSAFIVSNLTQPVMALISGKNVVWAVLSDGTVYSLSWSNGQFLHLGSMVPAVVTGGFHNFGH